MFSYVSDIKLKMAKYHLDVQKLDIKEESINIYDDNSIVDHSKSIQENEKNEDSSFQTKIKPNQCWNCHEKDLTLKNENSFPINKFLFKSTSADGKLNSLHELTELGTKFLVCCLHILLEKNQEKSEKKTVKRNRKKKKSKQTQKKQKAKKKHQVTFYTHQVTF